MGRTEVGRIDLGLNIDPGTLNKQLKRLASGAGKLVGSIFAVGAVAKFTKSCLDLGSDLTEVQNVVDTTFKTMNNQVNTFASNAMTQFGLSETVAKKYMGTLGAMSKAMGFSESAAYKLSESVTGLAGDVASFYNLSTDEAYTKLKSIWTGETETLKEIGVILTQTNLDQYALNNGFGKTTAKMTEQEKVMLRYQYTMSALADAQGDFAKTSGSWANQTRILSLQFDALKATLGQGFINLFTPIIQVINVLLGRLQVLAGYFKQFTELISGNRNQSSGGVSGIASDAGEAAGNLENMASGAKEAAKSLSGIDELNMVSDSGATGGTGGGSSDVPDLGLGDISADGITEDLKETNVEMQRFLDKAKELGNLFQTGFNLGFGDASGSIDAIKEHLSGIKKSLTDIFTDPEVKEAANNFVESIAINAGKVAGSAASVGMTIAENVVGGIDKYLEQNQDYIKDRFAKILDAGTSISNHIGDFAEVFTDIFTVFRGENAKQIAADLIGIFANVNLGITEMVARNLAGLTEILTTPFINCKEQIKTALKNTLEPVSSITSSIRELITNSCIKISEVYDQYVDPAFTKMATGLSTVFSYTLNAYNDYLAPVLDWISERFSLLADNYIQPLTDAISECFGKLVSAVAVAWEFLSPFIGWFVDFFIASFSGSLEGAWAVLEFGVSIVSTVIRQFTEMLSGMADFIAGVFTGDWERAWGGIKTIFESFFTMIGNIAKTITSFISNIVHGMVTSMSNSIISGLKGIKTVWDTIFKGMKTTVTNIFNSIWNFLKGIINKMLGGIEKMANGIVKALNKMINALNTLDFDVPDWVPVVGGKSLGFSIPSISEVSIPKLAQGGYVKPNQPQLAMIGDNRHQGEVVAPEGKLLEMAKQAATEGGKSHELMEIILLLRELLSVTKDVSSKELVAIISSSEIYKAYKNEKSAEQKRYGIT